MSRCSSVARTSTVRCRRWCIFTVAAWHRQRRRHDVLADSGYLAGTGLVVVGVEFRNSGGSLARIRFRPD